MTPLLEALAAMSALRERDTLETTLVQCVRQTAVPQSLLVRWLQVIGPPADLHWQVRAAYTHTLDTSEREQSWADWSQLPRLEERSARHQAWLTRQALSFGTDPCTTLFPVCTHDGPAGLLEIESQEPLDANTHHTVQTLLRIYANLVGLLDYGEKDALTGLLNRKSFDSAFVRAAMLQAVPSEPATERRTPSQPGPYWMAVLDIDHFKRVNDEHGHLIGDEVLVLLAHLMRHSLRLLDQLYRFGGEEFVILMRCPDHTQAFEVLERFRRAVEDHPFPRVQQVTVSIGFTALLHDDTPDLAFNRADQAVYHAKAHGRNRVCGYAELVDSGRIASATTSSDDIEFF